MNRINKDYVTAKERIFGTLHPYPADRIELEGAHLVLDETLMALIKHLGLEKKDK
jgi:hypothetical protein